MAKGANKAGQALRAKKHPVAPRSTKESPGLPANGEPVLEPANAVRWTKCLKRGSIGRISLHGERGKLP